MLQDYWASTVIFIGIFSPCIIKQMLLLFNYLKIPDCFID